MLNCDAFEEYHKNLLNKNSVTENSEYRWEARNREKKDTNPISKIGKENKRQRIMFDNLNHS